jgi:hypothetical protein
MADKIFKYPQSAKDLASLLKNADSEKINDREIQTKAWRILKTMNPRDLALYLAENPTCLKGLKLVNDYYKKQNEPYKAEFRKYLGRPKLLGLPD